MGGGLTVVVVVVILVGEGDGVGAGKILQVSSTAEPSISGNSKSESADKN